MSNLLGVVILVLVVSFSMVRGEVAVNVKTDFLGLAYESERENELNPMAYGTLVKVKMPMSERVQGDLVLAMDTFVNRYAEEHRQDPAYLRSVLNTATVTVNPFDDIPVKLIVGKKGGFRMVEPLSTFKFPDNKWQVALAFSQEEAMGMMEDIKASLISFYNSYDCGERDDCLFPEGLTLNSFAINTRALFFQRNLEVRLIFIHQEDNLGETVAQLKAGLFYRGMGVVRPFVRVEEVFDEGGKDLYGVGVELHSLPFEKGMFAFEWTTERTTTEEVQTIALGYTHSLNVLLQSLFGMGDKTRVDLVLGYDLINFDVKDEQEHVIYTGFSVSR